MNSKRAIAVAAGATIALTIIVIASVHPGEVNTSSANTVDLDSNSGAFGTDCDADDKSLAVGSYNIVSDRSLAVGQQNTAQYASLASGVSNVVTLGGVAFGSSNDVDSAAAAIGSLNAIVGQNCDDSILAGTGHLILGGSYQATSNVMLGYDHLITRYVGHSERNFLAGNGNVANSKSDCWVIGKGNIGSSETLIVGTYSEAVSDASFVVGTGTTGAAEDRENGLVVYKNGDVVIPKVQGDISMGSYADEE